MHPAMPWRAIVAGFIATLIMTAVIYLAPVMGLPKLDIAGMLGSGMSGIMPAPGSAVWWTGMIIHFMLGSVVFALIYAYWLYPVLPNGNWLRGAIWGTILWFLMQAIVMPMMGSGIFSGNEPDQGMIGLATLIVHWIYGVILGTIAGVQATREPFHRQERHA